MYYIEVLIILILVVIIIIAVALFLLNREIKKIREYITEVQIDPCSSSIASKLKCIDQRMREIDDML